MNILRLFDLISNKIEYKKKCSSKIYVDSYASDILGPSRYFNAMNRNRYMNYITDDTRCRIH